MNICMTHYAFFPTTGGVESHLLDLCAGLKAAGHNVLTLVGSLEGRPKQETVEGIPVYRTDLMNPEWIRDRKTRKAIAAEKGIALRLTTDVKHVEFGLTDKSDSVAWIIEHLAKPAGIRTADILILGDEFGPINGFEGSDYRMVGLPDATYVSVGKEPNGVPEGVLHVGGGAAAFLDILQRQIECHHRVHAP